MENLILTGWGWKDYACAAALALRHWKKADIFGMSTRRLPEFLYDVGQYKNIVILGIGLTGTSVNPARSLVALFAGGEALKCYWVFVLGPVVGAVLAYGVHELLAGDGTKAAPEKAVAVVPAEETGTDEEKDAPEEPEDSEEEPAAEAPAAAAE